MITCLRPLLQLLIGHWVSRQFKQQSKINYLKLLPTFMTLWHYPRVKYNKTVDRCAIEVSITQNLLDLEVSNLPSHALSFHTTTKICRRSLVHLKILDPEIHRLRATFNLTPVQQVEALECRETEPCFFAIVSDSYRRCRPELSSQQ